MEWLPEPAALPWSEYQKEITSFRKLHRLIDTYEALYKYLAIISIQNFYKANLATEFSQVDSDIRKAITRPAMGDWARFLSSVLKSFSKNQEKLFSPDLYSFCYKGPGNNPKLQDYIKNESECLLQLRNFLAHGATLDEGESEARVQKYEPFLKVLFERSQFLQDLELIIVQPQTTDPVENLRLLFLSNKKIIEKPHNFDLISNHVYLYSNKDNKFLDLYPLLIYSACNEFMSVFDPVNKNIQTQLCGVEKILLYNSQKKAAVEFLDYWKGHHSNFKQSESLSRDINIRFKIVERKDGKKFRPDWLETYITNITENFVGRDEDLKVLDDFKTPSAHNILVIIGDPGIGKTTLLAKFADENQFPRHFIKESDAETLDPIHVFENLALQVEDRYGVKWKRPVDRDISDYRREFLDTLKAASKQVTEPIMIIIDGLDECISYGTRDDNSILAWLPEENDYPEGVKVILSTRKQLIRHPLFTPKFGEDKASHRILGKLKEGEIRGLLYQIHSKYEVITNKKFVDAVVNKSDGNPLYLKMLMNDITNGDIVFGDISKLPVGIRDYFDRIISKIEGGVIKSSQTSQETSLRDVENTLQDLVSRGSISPEEKSDALLKLRENKEKGNGIELLSLFCLVYKPLDLDTAASILGISSAEIESLFNQIQTVLVEKENGEFTIFHNSFREYFLKLQNYSTGKVNRYQEMIKAVSDQIINWCSRWKEHQNPYAIRFYTRHLSETKQFDEVYNLAKNKDFLKLQENYDPSLSLETLRLAIEMAIERDQAGNIARFSLEHAKRAENLRSGSPFDAFKKRDWEGAIMIAKLYEPKYQFLWFFLIASELYRIGHPDQAINTLKELISYGNRMPIVFGWEEEFYDEIVNRLIDWAETDILVDLGKLLQNGDDRAIMALIRKQEFKDAQKLICEIFDPKEKDSLKGIAAIHMVRAGMFTEAHRLVQSIDNTDLRTYYDKVINETREIVIRYKEKFPEISAENIDRRKVHNIIYMDIAKGWASDGNFEAAIRTIEYYFPHEQWLSLFEEISWRYCQSHDEGEAINIALNEDDELRETVMAGIALARSSDVSLESALRIYANYRKMDYDREFFKNPIDHINPAADYVRMIIKRYPDFDANKSFPDENISEEFIYQLRIFLLAEEGDLFGALNHISSSAMKNMQEEKEFSKQNDDERRRATSELASIRTNYLISQSIRIFFENNNAVPDMENILQYCKNNKWAEKEVVPAIIKELVSRGEYSIIDDYRTYLSSDELLEIALIVAGLGDTEFVRSIIKIFKERQQGNFTDSQLRSLVECLARIGDFHEATLYAETATSFEKKVSLFLTIVKIMFNTGLFAQATDILAQMLKEIRPKHSTTLQDNAFKSVALGYSKQGSYVRAKSYLSFINNDEVRRATLSGIAVDQANRGDIKTALSTYEEIDKKGNLTIINQICTSLCRMQRFVESLKIAKKYKDRSAIFNTLEFKSMEDFKIGKIEHGVDQICKAFQSLFGNSADQYALYGISGAPESLLRDIRQNQHGVKYENILMTLAKAFDEHSFRIIIDGKDCEEFFKAEILIRAGETLIRDGQEQVSREFLSRAMKHLDGDTFFSNDTHLLPLLRSFTKLGEIPNAIICYNKLKAILDANPGKYSLSVSEFHDMELFRKELMSFGIDPEEAVDVESKLNQEIIEKLIRWAEQIEDEEPSEYQSFTDRDEMEKDPKALLIKISDWYSRYGDDEEFRSDLFDQIQMLVEDWAYEKEYPFAIQIAQLLGNEYQRAEAFCTVAKAQIKNEKFEEAVKTSGLILEKRNELIPQIVESFVQNKAFDYFKRMIVECIADLERAYRLCEFLINVYPGQIDDIALEIQGIREP
ncbi:MAG: AAA family ATPase [Anaerolineales bacterium]|jgi:adenylate kinase family enzyme